MGAFSGYSTGSDYEITGGGAENPTGAAPALGTGRGPHTTCGGTRRTVSHRGKLHTGTITQPLTVPEALCLRCTYRLCKGTGAAVSRLLTYVPCPI